MYIKHDKSYITDNQWKLTEKGYATLSVHSIHFNRYFTNEEKTLNRIKAQSMSSDEWAKSCDVFSKSLDMSMREILDVFVSKYDIHQVTPETSTMEHYCSDWDLYFYGYYTTNDKKCLDSFSLTFNDLRTADQNINLLKELLPLIRELEYKNVHCRVQFKAVIIDYDKVYEKALSVYENLDGKYVKYLGLPGKIKVVSEINGKKNFGFFRKNAKSRYYRISYEDMLLLSC